MLASRDIAMSKKTRVLYLLENAGMGGINARSLRLAEGFRRYSECEVEFSVLSRTNEGWLFEAARAKGIPINVVPCRGPVDLLVIKRLADHVKALNIDIVHTQQVRGNFFVRLAADLGLIRTPIVVTKPGVFIRDRAYPRTYLYYELDKRPTRLADKVIAVDSSTFQAVQNWGIKDGRLVVIHNPIDPVETEATTSELRRNLTGDNARVICLYLGRLDVKKGLRELIDATRHLTSKGIPLLTVLAGEGPDRGVCERMIADMNLGQHVKLVGEVVDVKPYLSACDFLSLPSYSEGLPNAILEALAFGKAVVATKVGGIPDLIEHGKNGLLVERGSVDSLVRAFEELTSAPEKLLNMGRQGQEIIRKRFAVDRAIALYDEVYRSVLRCRSQGPHFST